MDRKKISITTIFILCLLICFSIKTVTYAATWSGVSPIPLDNKFELVSSSYDYNPALNTLTKTYQYKNISGSAITNPRIVTLFTWSNDICSPSWESMSYDGSAIFSNSAQSATMQNHDGLFNWNALVSNPTPPLDSSGLFPSLPSQSTQQGVSYPYTSICTTTAGQWANDEVVTFSLSFINVLNPYWVQSLSWVVSCDGPDCPADPLDDDNDGISACFDNCPHHPNGPLRGTCTKIIGANRMVSNGQYCTSDANCDPGEFCEKTQEDNYPPGGNNIGDACDCESDFNCDGSVVADDVAAFLDHFGRSSLAGNPCTNASPCDGDFLCDTAVHAGDVSKFLEDFGRTTFGNACPACVQGNWCAYP